MRWYKILHHWSVDVGIGAVLFQIYFHKILKGQLPEKELSIALFLGLWLIYLLDRKIDVSIFPITDQRHLNQQKSQWTFWMLVVGIGISLAFVLFLLPQEVICQGIILSIGIAFYWLATIFKWFNKYLKKEFFTALFYALGIFIPFQMGFNNLLLILLVLLFLLVFHHLKLFLSFAQPENKVQNKLIISLEFLIVGLLISLIIYSNFSFWQVLPLSITLGVQLIIHYFYPNLKMRGLAEIAYWSPIIYLLYDIF